MTPSACCSTATATTPDYIGDLPNVAVARLTSLGLVRLSGKDARDFLQRVLTNDVLHLGDGVALTGYCDPKGRLLGIMRMWLDGDDAVYMLIPKASAPAIIKRLKMFVLRDDVTITCAAEGRAFYAITQDADSVLKAAGCPVPQAWNVAREGDTMVLSLPQASHVDGLPIGGARAIVIAPEKAIFFEKTADDTLFWASEVAAGVPMVWPETSGLFVPQAVNLDALHGISFTKGCYTGQEVISRLQHIGKTNRRALWAETTGALPKPGSDVFANGEPVGYVVEAAQLGDRVFVFMSLLLEASSQPLSLDKDGAQRLALGKLPYSVE